MLPMQTIQGAHMVFVTAVAFAPTSDNKSNISSAISLMYRGVALPVDRSRRGVVCFWRCQCQSDGHSVQERIGTVAQEHGALYHDECASCHLCCLPALDIRHLVEHRRRRQLSRALIDMLVTMSRERDRRVGSVRVCIVLYIARRDG